MKKIKIILLIFICSFISCGCGNYRELNYLAITTGISFDKDEDGYLVSYMVANPGKTQSDSKKFDSQSVLYEGKGRSISEASFDLNNKIPKIPYISHLEVIVISDEIAKDGVLDILDYLMRNPESRKEFYIVLSKDVKANQILKTLSPLESLSSENISNNISTNRQQQSNIIIQGYSDFISKILDEGSNPVLSGIVIEGDKKEGEKPESVEQTLPSSNIKFAGVGIFKKDKLIGWVNNENATGVNIINNNAKNVVLQTKCDDKFMVSFLNKIKTDIKINLKDKIPNIKLKIEASGSLDEINCKKNLENKEIFKNIEKDFENELKKLIIETLHKAQTYKVDIFNFGNKIYKEDFKKWNKIKNDWDELIFPNLNIEVDTKVKLKNKGSFEQTLNEVENE